jgi:hypothetical protein
MLLDATDQSMSEWHTYSLCSHDVVFTQGGLMATSAEMDTAYSTCGEHDVAKLNPSD